MSICHSSECDHFHLKHVAVAYDGTTLFSIASFGKQFCRCQASKATARWSSSNYMTKKILS
jgi:hypothetical protein